MSRDLRLVETENLPDFGPMDQALSPEAQKALRRPILIGGAIILFFVLGAIIWAIITPLASAITAPGFVRVESNRKIIRHNTGGIVRAIPVKEGQRVAANQPLLVLDKVQAQASVDVFQSQYDAMAAQLALFSAEAQGKKAIAFPPELLARAADPAVATVLREQETLFQSRLQLFESQTDVLSQRMEQSDAQIAGVQAQLESVAEQERLTKEEMTGYQTLYEKGYAPKTLILRYNRTLADLLGRKGALNSEIVRLNQQKGETRMQLATLKDTRISQAAQGLRQMQTAMAETGARLTAARQNLAQTTLRSPVDGYVLGLSQYTIGGVVGAGEVVMEIVPANAPLIIWARIKPSEINSVKVGMPAKVRIAAFNSRKVSPLEAKVVGVSADLIEDPKGGGYFRVDVRIPAEQLAKLPKGSVLSPGMPAQVMVRTGERTVMSYILSPLTDSIGQALQED